MYLSTVHTHTPSYMRFYEAHYYVRDHNYVVGERAWQIDEQCGSSEVNYFGVWMGFKCSALFFFTST